MDRFFVTILFLATCGPAIATSYAQAVNVSISCTELSVAATFNKDEFTGGNITHIAWNDPMCQG